MTLFWPRHLSNHEAEMTVRSYVWGRGRDGNTKEGKSDNWEKSYEENHVWLGRRTNGSLRKGLESESSSTVNVSILTCNFYNDRLKINLAAWSGPSFPFSDIARVLFEMSRDRWLSFGWVYFMCKPSTELIALHTISQHLYKDRCYYYPFL